MDKVKGIFFIVASIFITAALGFSGFRFYRSRFLDKTLDPTYVIKEIIQTGPEKMALPTTYLAELMNLSCDKPQNYFSFDEKLAEENLLKSAVIKKAKVKKIKQDAVYVDYEVFRPIALLGDSSNLAMDEEGHIFPIEPFYSQKRLPEIYFGSAVIDKEKFDIALAIFSYLDNREAFRSATIKSVDISKALHESFGKREVVIVLEENGNTWYLRLTPHKFPEELNNFVLLKDTMPVSSKKKKVVDLRLAKAAYIEEVS